MYAFMDILVIFIVLMFIIIFGIVMYMIIKTVKAPVLTEKAKVVSKRKFRNPSNNVNSYRVTFDINGQLVELAVKYLVYDSLNEGDEGILTYKGMFLVNFEKNI